MRKSFISTAVLVALAAPTLVFAEDAAPAAPAADAAPAAPVLMQGMNFPLALPANPLNFDAGPIGKVYASGILTATGFGQTNKLSAANTVSNPIAQNGGYFDITNAQAIIQKIDGPYQFYIQGGGYDVPVVGQAYTRSSTYTKNSYGFIPVAFAKWAPTDSFSLQGGKLPTLFGTEYTFSFQNSNIERGLLWNQENVITRGVQANYATGPLAFSVQATDGFYTKDFNYLTGSASWTINDSNALTVVAGGNVGSTKIDTFENLNVPLGSAQLAQANSGILNIYYKYTNGPWTLQPIVQYTHMTKGSSPAGNYGNGGTVGASMIANYAINSNFNVSARAEYINESGGNDLLGYSATGAKAPKAWSLTLTPTYQEKSFLVRGELSYVGLSDATSGYEFGSAGKDSTQVRGMVETGFMF